MVYRRENADLADVAALGKTEEGLPELVQLVFDSGRTVTAEYSGVHQKGDNPAHVEYETLGRDEPVKTNLDAVEDTYDIIRRVAEAEGYQSSLDEILKAGEELEPLPMGEDQERGSEEDVRPDDDPLEPRY